MATALIARNGAVFFRLQPHSNHFSASPFLSTMSAPAIKLPLALKKDFKDLLPRQEKAVADIAEIMGCPVTNNWSLEKCYAALEGHSNQGAVAGAWIGNYIEGMVELFKRDVKGDAMTLATLNKVWTTKNITFTVGPKGDQRPEELMHAGSQYAIWRIMANGDLDLLVGYDRFYSNVQYTYTEVKMADLLANAPGDALPLALRKDFDKLLPRQQQAVDAISEIVGQKVTNNWSIEAAYAALKGHADAGAVAGAWIGNYIEGMVECFKRDVKGDAMTLETLLSVWTTRNITFTVVPKDHVFDDKMVAGSNYSKWRITPNGDLDIAVPFNCFYCNVHCLYTEFKMADLLAKVKVPGSLPLSVRKGIVDTAAQQKAVTDRITAATGVPTTWDLTEDATLMISHPQYAKLREPFHCDYLIEYMESVAKLLEIQCADEMVKDAVADVFKGKVGFRLIEGETLEQVPMSAGDNYARIQFDGPNIWAVSTFHLFAMNIFSLRGHSIIQLF